MTKYKKDKSGQYIIKDKKYKFLVGSRAQVMHGTAYKTTGGLKKKDLCMNKHGRVVSCKLQKQAKKDKRLEKAGYKTKKGTFGAFKNGKSVTKKTKRKKTKRKARK